MEFTHFNSSGLSKMVDVTDKDKTHRTASATSYVKLNKETLEKVIEGTIKKGNVLAVAQVAGIMAAKILAVSDDALLEKIISYKEELKSGVMKKKDKIENVGYKKYMEEM